jgi:hypothetical protein
LADPSPASLRLDPRARSASLQRAVLGSNQL